MSSPSRKTRDRKPSHFGSKTHVSPAGNSPTRLASMGRTGGFTGSCMPHGIAWMHLSVREVFREVTMEKQKSAVLGILAGMAGGLAAAWVMNVFMAGPGQTLQQSVQSDEENREQQAHS